MSEGPISQERAARLPARSVARSVAVCAAGVKGRAYCGRKVRSTVVWALVTCADCLAARRGDEAKS